MIEKIMTHFHRIVVCVCVCVFTGLLVSPFFLFLFIRFCFEVWMNCEMNCKYYENHCCDSQEDNIPINKRSKNNEEESQVLEKYLQALKYLCIQNLLFLYRFFLFDFSYQFLRFSR